MIDRRSFLSGGALALSGMGLGLASAQAAEPDYRHTIARAREILTARLSEDGVPALTAALVSRQGLVWAEAFGQRDKAQGLPATAGTLFGIGSCSKVFAAIAAMMLVERGLVDLDAPITRYLPQFRMRSPEAGRITTRMLLSHASGFPGSDYRGALLTAPATDYLGQMLDTLSQSRLKHAPGELSVYCNDGFTVVEAIVRAMTGQDYPDFVSAEILAPLGMASSRFAREAFPEESFAHGMRDGRNMPQEYPSFFASGGLFSNAPDMAAFLTMLLNGGRHAGGQLLSRASLREMARDQTRHQPIRIPEAEDGYGLGWDGVRHAAFSGFGIPVWHKNGGTNTYKSEVFVAPRHGLALFLSGSDPGWNSRKAVEEIMLCAFVERGILSMMPPPVRPGATRAAHRTRGEKTVEGIYGAYDRLLRITRQPEGGYAMWNFEAGSWHRTGGTFALRAGNVLLDPMQPEQSFVLRRLGGIETLVIYSPAGHGHYEFEMPFAQKMEAGTALSPGWQKRLGRRWLLVNEPADSVAFSATRPQLKLEEIPGLPGYVAVSTADIASVTSQPVNAMKSDDVAEMCLRIPFAMSRDLNDLVVTERAGEEWVSSGSMIFRPADTVPVIGKQAKAFTAPEGEALWFRADAPATVAVANASAWKTFDATLKLVSEGRSGTPALPAGGFLLVFGRPGQPVRVSLAAQG